MYVHRAPVQQTAASKDQEWQYGKRKRIAGYWEEWRSENEKVALRKAQAWDLGKNKRIADGWEPWMKESQLPPGAKLMPLSADQEHLAKTEVFKGCGYNVEHLYVMGDYTVKQAWQEYSEDFRGPGIFPLEMCLLQWRLDNATKRQQPLPNRHFVHETKGYYGTTLWVEAHTTKRRKCKSEEFSETPCADFGACFGCKWQQHPHLHTPICGGYPKV